MVYPSAGPPGSPVSILTTDNWLGWNLDQVCSGLNDGNGDTSACVSGITFNGWQCSRGASTLFTRAVMSSGSPWYKSLYSLNCTLPDANVAQVGGKVVGLEIDDTQL